MNLTEVHLNSISTRIRQARRAAGLTQANLASDLGVGRSAVAQWERDEGSKPTASNLARLAVALHCAHEWLATGRGSRSIVDVGGGTVVLRHMARDDGEEQLLSTYRSLDERNQRVALKVLDALVDGCRGKPQLKVRPGYA